MMEEKTMWALILGGSKGLGLATAHKLASQGYNLILVHRDRAIEKKALETEIKKMKAHQVEVFNYNKDAVQDGNRKMLLSDIQGSLGAFKIDVLVHSIAKGSVKPITTSNGPELNSEDILLTLNAMAVSFYSWTKALVDAKLFSKKARVIAFTSEGSSKFIPGYTAVASAKKSLESLMKNMAVVYAPYGLRVNCIQAGVTDTASLRKIPKSELLLKESVKRNPFKRLTTPADVANVVAILCLNEADWINGTIIKVDGGESLM
ncbi:SDR family oxidoreductase [Eudoraea chungangensis]|uniref:SDR family oxidoreductase n=1 Tax=Eudoraea chungangensis TaxID=1481905 RepID=UPI0023EB7FE9|nr:SDR family oxidoreductase [Eudoraea chungangensis]